MTENAAEEVRSNSSVRFLAFVVDDDNRTRRLLALLYPAAAIIVVVATSVVALVLHFTQVAILIAGLSTISMFIGSPLRRFMTRIRDKDHGNQPGTTDQSAEAAIS